MQMSILKRISEGKNFDELLIYTSLAFRITPGNVDDREPVPELTQGLTGKLIGDRGYISSQLFHVL